jgi:trimeric autotransporter adhesin
MHHRHSATVFASALVLGSALTLDPALPAQWLWTPGQGLPGVDVGAMALARWDPDGSGPLPPLLALGGQFAIAGTAVASHVATFDLTSGTWSALGQGTSDRVFALAATPQGLVAGGAFTSAGSAPARHVARWNGTSWQPLGGVPAGGGVDHFVLALAVLPNGDLVAGGRFTTAGGVPAAHIARWNGSTWSAIAGGVDGPVHALSVAPNGDLVAGGTFSHAGGAAANNIARFDGSQWQTLGSGTDGAVLALYHDANGDLTVGGFFGQAGGTTAHRLARWNGAAWSALQLPAPPPFGQQSAVRTIARDLTGELVIGGDFSLGVLTGGVLRLTPVGWQETTCPGGVWALAAVPGHGLTLAGGSHGVGRIDGPTERPLHRGIDGPVEAFAEMADGSVVLGGSFRTFDGQTRPGVVRRVGPASFAPLAAGIQGRVRALEELADGRLVAGGLFDLPAQGLRHLAVYNGLFWTSLGGGANGAVHTVCERQGGALVVGGAFGSVGSPPVISGPVASWSGTAWTPMGGNLNGPVERIVELPNGDLVAAGTFSNAGNIARWNGSTWVALGGGTNAAVRTLVVLPDGRLVAGGDFTAAGGQFAAYTAVWDGTSWQPFGHGLGGPVRSLSRLPTGELIAAGDFQLASGLYANGLARGDAFGWIPLYGFTAHQLFGSASAVHVRPSGELLVGGAFVGSTTGSAHLAQAAPVSPAAAAVVGSGCAAPGGPAVLRAEVLPWLGATYRSTTTGLPANALAVLVRGFSPASVPLPLLLPQGLPGCSLLVSPDILATIVPQGSTATATLPLPLNFALIGMTFREQVAPFVIAGGAITAVSSSNALLLTIGTL